MAALDINAIKDAVSIWHAESVKLLQERAGFAEENKSLRAELESTKRSLNESQELNAKMKADHSAAIEALKQGHARALAVKDAQMGDLREQNAALAQERDTHKADAAEVREKFCPQIAAEKRAAKARELEQLKVRSAALEAELKTAEPPAA